MNIAEIKYNDIANGIGVRTSVFVSGCSHHCKGCFQPETWCPSFGRAYTDEDGQAILDSLAPAWISGLTLLGGEPMEPYNQAGLLPLVRAVKTTYPEKTIWCYTGDVLEDLCNPASTRHTADTDDLLSYIDVLIDGPFVEDLKDITLRFRGSSNQRLIDLNRMRVQMHTDEDEMRDDVHAGVLRPGMSVVLWEDETRAFATHSW